MDAREKHKKKAVLNSKRGNMYNMLIQHVSSPHSNEVPKDVSVAVEILVVVIMLGWTGTESILSRRTGWCPAGMAHRSRITTKIFTTISFVLN